LQVQPGRAVTLPIPPGHIAALAVLRGEIRVNDSRPVSGVELVLLEADGDEMRLEAGAASAVLLLSGAPILEPIVGHGPFVMNSSQEIETAIDDFRRGKFGRMSHAGARSGGN
jgi:redox-sensitive bicupin YhaK (pirin superfamily)